jgi:S-DNA-T family DNA segregation ATPase FtsK/SpoIIIE
MATRHLAEAAVPTLVAAKAVAIAVTVISVAWGPLLLAAPWVITLVGGAALWHVGRAASGASPAGWSAAETPAGEDGGIVVTADTIVLALQHLPIPELRKAFKDGWRPIFHTQPVRDGRGYFAVFGLPLGVTAEMIADRRAVLARNVHRAEVEVWPSDAEKAGVGPAGTVAVWIADSGVLSRAAPEYPLLHDGTADVFAGVPAGVVARGDGIGVPIVANNWVAGGQMGQGKSNSCRVIMLGCALDPLAELDVFVFANNGDFDAYAPRLAIYVKGVEDDALAAAVGRLQELYAEVARREGRLAELGAKKVTRGLAERYPDLRPVVALFSECHELFGHAEYGPIATELVTKTAKRARKTAITLGFDTQSSRKEAIPPKLVELVSVNVCFYVKTWRSNDGFLGDGSFAAGIRATELRPGRDRGTSVITGVSDSQFELLRWYFVAVDDDTGFDAAAEVIARAVRQAAPGTPVGSGARPAIETRDLLEDLGEAMGDERVRLADLPALLRDLAPTWGPYRSLTGVRLKELLDEQGVRVVTKANVSRLDPADLRQAIASRDERGR